MLLFNPVTRIRPVACFILIIWMSGFSATAWGSCSDDLGACGGDEQRLCVDDFFQAEFSCCAEKGAIISESGLNCAIPRKLGDRCSAFFPCAQPNLACELQPWEPALRCAQKKVVDTGGALGGDLCEALYSKDVHSLAKSGYASVMTIGGGAQGSATTPGGVGITGTVELGTAYAKDGRYGCYHTFCSGGTISTGQGLSAGIFVALGQYDKFNLATSPETQPGHFFPGDPSFALVDTIQIQYINATFSVSLGAVASADDVELVTLGNTYAVGLGASSLSPSPFGASAAALGCYTQAVELHPVYFPPGAQFQEAEQYLETESNTVGIGTESSPFNDFELALKSMVLAEPDVSKGEKRLWIDGDITLNSNTHILRGASPPGQITLSARGRSCSVDGTTSCTFASDCPDYGACSVSNNSCSRTNPCGSDEFCLPVLTCDDGSICQNNSQCLDGGGCEQPRARCEGTTFTANSKTCFSGSDACSTDIDCPNYGVCLDEFGSEGERCSSSNPCNAGEQCVQAFNDAFYAPFAIGPTCRDGRDCNEPRDFCAGLKISFEK